MFKHYIEGSNKVIHGVMQLCFSVFDKKVRDKGSGHPLLRDEILFFSTNFARNMRTAFIFGMDNSTEIMDAAAQFSYFYMYKSIGGEFHSVEYSLKWFFVPQLSRIQHLTCRKLNELVNEDLTRALELYIDRVDVKRIKDQLMILCGSCIESWTRELGCSHSVLALQMGSIFLQIAPSTNTCESFLNDLIDDASEKSFHLPSHDVYKLSGTFDVSVLKMKKKMFEGINFYSTITSARFKELNVEFCKKCMEPVEKCLRDAPSSLHVCLPSVNLNLPRVPVDLNNSSLTYGWHLEDIMESITRSMQKFNGEGNSDLAWLSFIGSGSVLIEFYVSLLYLRSLWCRFELVASGSAACFRVHNKLMRLIWVNNMKVFFPVELFRSCDTQEMFQGRLPSTSLFYTYMDTLQKDLHIGTNPRMVEVTDPKEAIFLGKIILCNGNYSGKDGNDIMLMSQPRNVGNLIVLLLEHVIELETFFASYIIILLGFSITLGWKNGFQDDTITRFDKLKAIVSSNGEVSKWNGLFIIYLQVVTLFCGMILEAVRPYQCYGDDGDCISTRLSRLNHPPPSPIGATNYVSTNHAWHSEINSRY